jgi:hypothetical protein
MNGCWRPELREIYGLTEASSYEISPPKLSSSYVVAADFLSRLAPKTPILLVFFGPRIPLSARSASLRRSKVSRAEALSDPPA